MNKIIKKNIHSSDRTLVILALRVINSYISSGLENISPLFLKIQSKDDKVLGKIREVAKLYNTFYQYRMCSKEVLGALDDSTYLLFGTAGVYSDLKSLIDSIKPEFKADFPDIFLHDGN